MSGSGPAGAFGTGRSGCFPLPLGRREKSCPVRSETMALSSVRKVVPFFCSYAFSAATMALDLAMEDVSSGWFLSP